MGTMCEYVVCLEYDLCIYVQISLRKNGKQKKKNVESCGWNKVEKNRSSRKFTIFYLLFAGPSIFNTCSPTSLQPFIYLYRIPTWNDVFFFTFFVFMYLLLHIE